MRFTQDPYATQNPRLPPSPHQGQMHCDDLLSPSSICMLHVCLLALVQERERERECTPSCNVGINIHGASGACRGYGAGVEIWQSGCVSRLRECVFVYLTAQGKGHLQFLIDKGHRLLSDAIGIHHYYCSSGIVM